MSKLEKQKTVCMSKYLVKIRKSCENAASPNQKNFLQTNQDHRPIVIVLSVSNRSSDEYLRKYLCIQENFKYVNVKATTEEYDLAPNKTKSYLEVMPAMPFKFFIVTRFLNFLHQHRHVYSKVLFLVALGILRITLPKLSSLIFLPRDH